MSCGLPMPSASCGGLGERRARRLPLAVRISTSARLARPIASDRCSPSWRLMTRSCSNSSRARPSSRRPPRAAPCCSVATDRLAAVAGRGPQVHRGLEAAPGRGPVAQIAVRRAEHGGGVCQSARRRPSGSKMRSAAGPGGPPRRSRRSPRPARRPSTAPARPVRPRRWPGPGQERGQPCPARRQPAADQPPAPQRRAHRPGPGRCRRLVRPLSADSRSATRGRQPGGPAGAVRPGQAALAVDGELGEMHRVAHAVAAGPSPVSSSRAAAKLRSVSSMAEPVVLLTAGDHQPGGVDEAADQVRGRARRS